MEVGPAGEAGQGVAETTGVEGTADKARHPHSARFFPADLSAVTGRARSGPLGLAAPDASEERARPAGGERSGQRLEPRENSRGVRLRGPMGRPSCVGAEARSPMSESLSRARAGLRVPLWDKTPRQ